MELIPLEIGPYQIKNEIGRGGMAVVYQATDTRTRRDVALKVLLPQYMNDLHFVRRFIKEGQATESLCHDNIVRTFDSGEGDGYYYIAMQLIEGGTLLDYVQRRKQLLSADEIISVLSQVAAGLDYAHSLGFLHRDIKLSNILMTDDGMALLSDFGVVKHIDRPNTMATMVGHTVGTPAFMAPEQARGESTDGRADVYSLGVVAYTLFTGRLPFQADNQPQLMYKIVHEMPVSPDNINPDIPVGIVPAVNRALSKDPSRRYASSGEFVAALVAGRMWTRKPEPEKPPVGMSVLRTPTTSPPPMVMEARWQGAYAFGWAVNVAVLLGLLWFVLSPTLNLNRKLEAAFNGDVRSARLIETGVLINGINRLGSLGSSLEFGSLSGWLGKQQELVGTFEGPSSFEGVTSMGGQDFSKLMEDLQTGVSSTAEQVSQWVNETFAQVGGSSGQEIQMPDFIAQFFQ